LKFGCKFMLKTMFLCSRSDIIPKKLHKYSGVCDHPFRIQNAYPYQNFNNMPGWPCAVYHDSQWKEVYLPYDKFPNEVEALAILSRLDGETEREGRYIRIHAAYEAVVVDRNVDYSSIRHFLAHPIVCLTRPNVQESLIRRFGIKGLSISNYQHRKEFYRCIGQMLIAVDKAVYTSVISKWDRVIFKKT
jgi:hypothetical protein